MNFHRRHEGVVQVINLQCSQGSNWKEKSFYVNVGIALDSICQLKNLEVLEKPKEYECGPCGTLDRMENLVAGADECWSMAIDGDLEGTLRRLGACTDLLANELQKIDSVLAYRQHHWFDRFRPKQENAQILHILGELDAAWKEVDDLCKLFADRESICRTEYWLKELGLSGLATRLKQTIRQN